MTQMIENSERGITLNKSLAWTILVAVLSGGIWIGVQITAAKEGITTLSNRQDEDRQSIRDNSSAINVLRSSNARIDERLIGIESTAQRTETSVSEILRYLRGSQFNPNARD